MRKIFILILAVMLFCGHASANTISDGSITVSGVAVGISNIPDGAKTALIVVEGDDVYVGFKTTPTGSTGVLMHDGDNMVISDFHDINSLRVIFKSGSSSSTIRYILSK